MPILDKKAYQGKKPVYQNWYGETYRLQAKIAGIQRKWDIHRITIPFSKEKEDALLERSGMEREHLPEFYRNLKQQVRNAFSNANTVKTLGASGTKSLAMYLRMEEYEENGITTFEYATAPMTPITESREYFEQGPDGTISTTQKALAAMLVKMIKIEEILAGKSISLIAFSLDDLYLVNLNGQNEIILGDLLLTYLPGNTILYDCFIPETAANEIIRNRREPDFQSGTVGIVKVFWWLFSGRHWCQAGEDDEVYNTHPRYAGTELADYMDKLSSVTTADAAEKILLELRKIKLDAKNRIPLLETAGWGAENEDSPESGTGVDMIEERPENYQENLVRQQNEMHIFEENDISPDRPKADWNLAFYSRFVYEATKLVLPYIDRNDLSDKMLDTILLWAEDFKERHYKEGQEKTAEGILSMTRYIYNRCLIDFSA